MTDVATPAFQRAFVALSYFTGRRDSELTAPLGELHAETQTLGQRWGHAERERRAEVLARELSRVAFALEARRLK